MNNYFISKDNKSGEIVYLEYDKEGYKVTPKRKKEDAIEVNKIVFVSPKLTEKTNVTNVCKNHSICEKDRFSSSVSFFASIFPSIACIPFVIDTTICFTPLTTRWYPA